MTTERLKSKRVATDGWRKKKFLTNHLTVANEENFCRRKFPAVQSIKSSRLIWRMMWSWMATKSFMIMYPMAATTVISWSCIPWLLPLWFHDHVSHGCYHCDFHDHVSHGCYHCDFMIMYPMAATTVISWSCIPWLLPLWFHDHVSHGCYHCDFMIMYPMAATTVISCVKFWSSSTRSGLLKKKKKKNQLGAELFV